MVVKLARLVPSARFLKKLCMTLYATYKAIPYSLSNYTSIDVDGVLHARVVVMQSYGQS